MKWLLAVFALALVVVAGCSPQRQAQGENVSGGIRMNALESIKWFGHASFRFTDRNSGNRVYYVDPFEFEGDGMEKADIIFITHAHQDHCDSGSVKRIVKPGTIIVVPSGCREKLNVTAEFVDVVPNKSYDIKGFKFRTVPAYNVHPERLNFHPKANNWVGYVFTFNGETVYHAGDTDFIPEMKQMGKINVALIPIGGTYTMTVEEAIEAANAIKADITVPMHFRRLLKGGAPAAEEKFKAGVKNSTVVIMEEVA